MLTDKRKEKKNFANLKKAMKVIGELDNRIQR